jgi:protoheme IX farnesyltransferase
VKGVIQTKTSTGSVAAEETSHGFPAALDPREAQLAGHAKHPSLFWQLSELFKARVTILVVLTAIAGFALGAHHTTQPFFTTQLLTSIIGVGLFACCAAALNEILERRQDAQMLRTRNRPLPALHMSLTQAWAWTVISGVAAFVVLARGNDLLTAILGMATTLSYALVYTPLKRITTLSTFIGAFPGAMPACLGWVAATGRVSAEFWALFAIQFFWQFPHFLAIAWIYREDYSRAGIRMLPVVDDSGIKTASQMLFAGLLLIPASLFPYWLGMTTLIYVPIAVLLGIGYLTFGVKLAMLGVGPASPESKRYARNVLKASVLYLPLLLILLVATGRR